MYGRRSANKPFAGGTKITERRGKKVREVRGEYAKTKSK
jgi:hypothetical protein